MGHILTKEHGHTWHVLENSLYKEIKMTLLPTLALRSFVGFDNLFNELESISNQKQSSFPAHDIVRISDDEYEITLAVSGFNKKDINIERTEEALATGANAIAVGCPFCLTMMTDGVKNKEKENEVKVYDLAEMIAKDMGI